jgi:AcrR family transcriptional regulator
MAQRVTLPQKRASETRQRILEAASRVFVRRGYGHATVEDIANEAEISIGALYHHFSGKEELFKELLEDHVKTTHKHFNALPPASSFREIIEQLASYWLDHLRSDHAFGDLSLEFTAEATRNSWAREIISAHQRQDLHYIEEMLRLGKSAGVVRSDLDIEAAAVLLAACLQGVNVLQTVDPAGIDLARLRRPLADLIERFITEDNPESISALPASIPALREQLVERLREDDRQT